VDARAALLDLDDRIVGIPLYDQIGCEGTQEDDPGYCPGGDRYHVDTVGCVEVLGWEHHLELDYLEDHGGGRDCWRDKAILVRMVCGDDCVSECGSTIGEPPAPWEMRAVSLIE
jgi:hypothetical protein